MRRTSLPEPPPPVGSPQLAAGATSVVEAATAEAAIARVHDELGPGARIVHARRARRGGIGGFFATEVVQLHAAPGPATPGPAAPGPAPDARQVAGGPAPGTDAAGAVGAGINALGVASATGPGGWQTAQRMPGTSTPSPVDRLLDGADDAPDTVDFATFLRSQMAREQSAPISEDVTRPTADEAVSVRPTGLAAPTVVAGPTVVAAPTASEDTACEDGPAWSRQILLQLGLPVGLVRRIDVGETADDVTWTMALARAVTGLCAALPPGPSLLVGEHADRLGDAAASPTARSRIWFEALRDGRWIHLVVGGDGWREHLAAGPPAVSWARAADLADALRCAEELDLVLGYGVVDGRPRRAQPLDVALAVRGLVDHR